MTATTTSEQARANGFKRIGDDPLSHLFRLLLRQVLEAVDAPAAMESPAAMIGVTSALRGEGVTTVAAGLARVAAATLRTGALLVDCHREPSGIEQLLGAEPKPGLADLVHRGADPEVLLSETALDGLSFLSAGSAEMRPRLYDDPCGLREMLASLSALERLTILDLPPVHEDSGLLEIASRLDGLLLVVEADRTPQEAVLSAQRRIARCQGRLLGVVLNKDPRRPAAGFAETRPAAHSGWFIRRNGNHNPPPLA